MFINLCFVDDSFQFCQRLGLWTNKCIFQHWQQQIHQHDQIDLNGHIRFYKNTILQRLMFLLTCFCEIYNFALIYKASNKKDIWKIFRHLQLIIFTIHVDLRALQKQQHGKSHGNGCFVFRNTQHTYNHVALFWVRDVTFVGSSGCTFSVIRQT